MSQHRSFFLALSAVFACSLLGNVGCSADKEGGGSNDATVDGSSDGGGSDGGGSDGGGSDASGDAAGDATTDGGGTDAAGDSAPTDSAPADTSNDGPIQVGDGGVVIMEDGGTSYVCRITSCAGKVLECGDCIDNDGDGRVDARDRECLGPCDNTEGPALTAGVGGESGGPCKSDCYFDFGNGPGNDDCHWDHRCDPLSIDPNYDPEGMGCALDESMIGGKNCPAEQSMTCHQVCRPLTPNGCDCFGCCTFPELKGRSPAEGGEYVWIGSGTEGSDKEGSCTFDLVQDRDACRPCTPVADCYNDCGVCELCIGKSTIPDFCLEPPPPVDAGTDAGGTDAATDAGGSDAGSDGSTDGGGGDGGTTPPTRCDAGIQPCGLESDPPCPNDTYCISGCCQPVEIF